MNTSDSSSQSNAGSGSSLMKWTLSKLNLRAYDNTATSGDIPVAATFNPANTHPDLSVSYSVRTGLQVAMAASNSYVASVCPAVQPVSAPPQTQTHAFQSHMLQSPTSPTHYRSVQYQDLSFYPHTPARRRSTTRGRIMELRGHEQPNPEVARLKEEIEILKMQNRNLHSSMMNVRRTCEEQDEQIALQSDEIRAIQTSLECPICMSCFSQPFFLSCGHTFCLGCLQSWFKSVREAQPATALVHCNNCPICRTIVLIPSPAYVLRSVLDVLNPVSPSLEIESQVLWEGIFEEELENCTGCGGLSRYGECLGFAGVFGRDAVVGLSNTTDVAQVIAQGDLAGIPHTAFE